ncbi:MAG: hypothetical protein JNK64_34210 [Myxococcales bacterium]|nr:hypothetical protein [Myxococcales bacterium]
MRCTWLSAVTLGTIGALGCAGARHAGPTLVTRAACAPTERWDDRACVPRRATAALAESEAAIKAADTAAALAALDRAAAEPLAWDDHVQMWEGRGLARAYEAEDQPTPATEAAARAAFDQLLAIDPTHHISCGQNAQATRRFERTRAELADRAPRALEITWPRDSTVGAPVPIDLEVVADPVGVLTSATVYLRTRGESTWRAADVPLPAPGQRARIRLPAIDARASTALELYAIAHDRAGNDTLVWASAAHPRDVPLRFDPPTPWYRTWWVWAIAGGVAATGAAVTAYALTWSPSDKIGGTVGRAVAP